MKRLISIILAIAMIATLGALSTAADAGEVAANKLFTLGLFIGVGDNADGTPNFELGREPTRAEGVTLLVRFLGKEKEALAGTWNTPFTDVADWAKPYVGYAYANGITYGISYTEYGGSIAITAAQYLTFILRALGYEDGYDFSWSSAWTLSDQIGFTAGEFNSRNNTILRGGVADISFKALIAKYFGTDTYVIRALYDEKVVTKQAVVDVGLGKYIEDEKTEEKEKETSSSDDYFSSPAKNPVITKSPTAATSKIAPDFSIVPVIISSLPNLDSTYYGVVGNKTLTYSGLATGDYVNITYDITNGTGSKKLNENDLYRVDVTLASPTNGGDMNNVYLLAYDGTNTFETIRTGYFGEYSGSPYTGTDGLKSASSLTFYATTAGTYTVNLKLYNVTAQAVALDIGDFTINVTGIAAAASENELVEALANPLVTAVVLNTDTTLTDDFEVPTGKTLILGNGVDLTLDTSGKTITITGAIQGEGGTPIAGPLTFGSLTNLTKDGAVTITGTATGVDIVLDSDGGSRNVLLQGDLVLATGNSLLIDGTPNIYKKDETWSITVEEGGEFTFSSTDIITSSGVATVGPTGSFQPATGGSVVFSATTGDTGWDFTIQGDVETSTAGVVLFDKFHLIVEEGAGLTLNDFQLFAQTANVGPTLEVNGTLTFTAVGSLRIDNLVDTGSIILGANAVLDLTDAVDNGLGVYLPAAATDQTIWLNWLADSILVDAEIGAQILVTKEQFVAFTDQTYALTTGLAGVSGGGTITLVRQAGSATITADPTTWTWAPYNGDVALTA